MEGKRIKTAFGELDYNVSDINKIIKVTIGKFYNARFIFYEDAMKFVELAISGGADPHEIKIIITFYKEGENENAAEN